MIVASPRHAGGRADGSGAASWAVAEVASSSACGDRAARDDRVIQRLQPRLGDRERGSPCETPDGCFNRRGFYRLFRREADARAGLGRVVARELDIENFKGLNDAFGHAFGDEVLKQLAHRLRTLIPRCPTWSFAGAVCGVVILLSHNLAGRRVRSRSVRAVSRRSRSSSVRARSGAGDGEPGHGCIASWARLRRTRTSSWPGRRGAATGEAGGPQPRGAQVGILAGARRLTVIPGQAIPPPAIQVASLGKRFGEVTPSDLSSRSRAARSWVFWARTVPARPRRCRSCSVSRRRPRAARTCSASTSRATGTRSCSA